MAKWRAILAAVLIAASALGAQAPDDRPLARRPYLGLSVRDTEHGLVVGWIHPGPLGGRSFDSDSGIRRGDIIVSLNAQRVDRDEFNEAIDALAPGDEVTLALRRSDDADPDAAVPQGGEGGELFTVRATLGSRDAWTGTIRRGLGDRTLADPPEGAHESRLRRDAQRLGVHDAPGGLAPLLDHLASVQHDAMDPNALPWVVHALTRPLSLDAVAEDLGAALAPLRAMAPDADPIGPLRATATDALDLGPPSGDPPPRIDHDAARRLVEAVRRGWSIDPEDARAQIAVINASAGAVGPSVRRAIDALGDTRATLLVLDSDPSRWSIEDAHEDAIEGGVRAAITDRTGRVVVLGTDADNVYDMSRIHAVLDPAGNDEYRWPDTPGSRRSSADRVVIDHDGDDRYLGETPFSGPGAGVFAGSLIDDHAGDDVYESPHAGSIGFGLFGVGVIIDRAGHDTYTNTGPDSGWSLGAGFYGVGLLIDHAGNDVYHAEKLAQGVGGPRGLGAILDARGADTYRANGPNFPSAYGTPGVFLGMSQGFGIGVRGYAAGGVGLIDDARGDDRYMAGEFSQGGGYYFGLGMIRDRAGDDLYAGNRYGQAFAAHQAAGVLIDDAGDDLYRSMTAASQSGAWDESVTMLIDRSGNDAYGCDSLGLGAASMQALSVFLDLAGDDRYSAGNRATLGTSGADTYHFDTTGVYSFSAFLDLGSGRDAYPRASARDDHEAATGAPNEDAPARATLHGVFIDE